MVGRSIIFSGSWAFALQTMQGKTLFFQVLGQFAFLTYNFHLETKKLLNLQNKEFIYCTNSMLLHKHDMENCLL